MSWAPWVQEQLDRIERHRTETAAWRDAERAWDLLTYLHQRGVVVEMKRRTRRMEKSDAAA